MGKQIAWKTAQFTSIFTILWLIAGYSFPLTHTILEMAGVVIAWMLFLFVWNARPFLESKFLLFIGFSYLFTGFFQLIHCMAFVETGLFPGSTENLVAQSVQHPVCLRQGHFWQHSFLLTETCT